MANPQLEDGYTSVANESMDALMRTNFSPYERRCLDCILRQTYGWHKKSDRISYSQFEEFTLIDRRHIGRAITSLKQRNIITVTGTGYALEYTFQKDYTKWKLTPAEVKDTTLNLTPPQGDLTPVQGESLPAEVSKSLPVEVLQKKENNIQKHYTKTNKNDDFVFVLPDWVNKEVWNQFVEMRKKIPKSPLTEYGKKLLIAELERFKNEGEDTNRIIENSIRNSWKGLFSLKGKDGGNYHGTNAAYKNQPKGTSETPHAIDGDAEATEG
jgi:phage replication O-like protein O